MRKPTYSLVILSGLTISMAMGDFARAADEAAPIYSSPTAITTGNSNDSPSYLLKSLETSTSDESIAFGVWKPTETIWVHAGFTNGNGKEVCGDSLECLRNLNYARNQIQHSRYLLGAQWRAFQNLQVGINYQTSDSRFSDSGANFLSSLPQSSTLATARHQGQSVDLSLSCDINAGSWGDLEVGVQLSHVSGDFSGMYSLQDNYSLYRSDPYAQAALGLGWQKGAFGLDLTSRYLDSLGDQAESPYLTSFDINFAWRTPWNGSLSVGATNVLNTTNASDADLSEIAVEQQLGRMPYVRYRQDL